MTATGTMGHSEPRTPLDRLNPDQNTDIITTFKAMNQRLDLLQVELEQLRALLLGRPGGSGGEDQERPAMSDEQRIFLGVEIESGEAPSTLALTPPPPRSRNAIARADRERAEKAGAESKTLREIFLDKVAIKRGDK